MTIRHAIHQATARLERAGVPDAAHDAGWLMGAVLHIRRLEALARGQEALTDHQAAAYQAFIARREQREPLQYILGETLFMGRRMLCRPGVLIPREDTEALCQAALARLPTGGRALDLCCGSGAIAISLKLERPDAHISASDIADAAIRLTGDNASLHSADIAIHQGDLLAPLQGQRFDLICCNPPYIPSQDLQSSQAELHHEPALALDGGADGLHFYRRLFLDAPRFLSPQGWLILELGDHQLPAIRALAQVDFGPLSLYDDYAGLPRVVAAPWKGTHAFSG